VGDKVSKPAAAQKRARFSTPSDQARARELHGDRGDVHTGVVDVQVDTQLKIEWTLHYSDILPDWHEEWGEEHVIPWIWGTERGHPKTNWGVRW